MMEPNNLLQLREALQPILDAALRPILNALEALDERVAGLDERVAGLDERVAGLNERVAGLDERVADLQIQLKISDVKATNADAKAINAQIGRSEPLLQVSLIDGRYPIIPGSGRFVEYPATISHLLVAGNEALPDGGLNNWNKKKSSMLLRAFGEASDNETDTEDGPTSRRYRLKVAKLLGVTKTQLNFAQITL